MVNPHLKEVRDKMSSEYWNFFNQNLSHLGRAKLLVMSMMSGYHDYRLVFNEILPEGVQATMNGVVNYILDQAEVKSFEYLIEDVIMNDSPRSSREQQLFDQPRIQPNARVVKVKVGFDICTSPSRIQISIEPESLVANRQFILEGAHLDRADNSGDVNRLLIQLANTYTDYLKNLKENRKTRACKIAISTLPPVSGLG